MTKLLLLPLVLLTLSLQAQIRLISVNPVTNDITIKNFGNADVDISDYRLCSNLNYTFDLDTDATVTILSGDLVLSQDEEVTVNWATLGGLLIAGRDAGLYLPGLPFVGFDLPDQMVDFMQYLYYHYRCKCTVQHLLQMFPRSIFLWLQPRSLYL